LLHQKKRRSEALPTNELHGRVDYNCATDELLPRNQSAHLDFLKAISMALGMKTTLIIEDTILKKAKEQAAARDTTVSELVNQSLRSYLHATSAAAGSARAFSMPVFGQPAARAASVTPAQLAELRDDGR
jgi:predicted DNA-binding ribbon-helix-helix protein